MFAARTKVPWSFGLMRRTAISRVMLAALTPPLRTLTLACPCVQFHAMRFGRAHRTMADKLGTRPAACCTRPLPPHADGSQHVIAQLIGKVPNRDSPAAAKMLSHHAAIHQRNLKVKQRALRPLPLPPPLADAQSAPVLIATVGWAATEDVVVTNAHWTFHQSRLSTNRPCEIHKARCRRAGAEAYHQLLAITPKFQLPLPFVQHRPAPPAARARAMLMLALSGARHALFEGRNETPRQPNAVGLTHTSHVKARSLRPLHCWQVSHASVHPEAVAHVRGELAARTCQACLHAVDSDRCNPCIIS